MKTLKRIKDIDVYKAFKYYAENNGVSFEGDYKEALKYFKENNFEVYELARNEDKFGKRSTFCLNIAEDDERDEEELYEEWVNKHCDEYFWLDHDTIIHEATNDSRIEDIIYHEITGV